MNDSKIANIRSQSEFCRILAAKLDASIQNGEIIPAQVVSDTKRLRRELMELIHEFDN